MVSSTGAGAGCGGGGGGGAGAGGVYPGVSPDSAKSLRRPGDGLGNSYIVRDLESQSIYQGMRDLILRSLEMEIMRYVFGASFFCEM